VKFTRLKEVAESHKADTLTELKRHERFAENCKRCVPYVLKMLKTGQTEFHEILEVDPIVDSYDPTPKRSYDDDDEL
jgi:hypothetical protein